MRALTVAALVLSGLLVFAAAGSAQTLGTVAGVVKDTSGAVLPGVSVEVASPALIEKTRSRRHRRRRPVRGGQSARRRLRGHLSLQGFSTVKRDGVSVLANFTANVNADLKVGAVTETVMVTGESPLIDVQGTITNRSVTPDLIKAIPNGGTMYQFAAMMPGVYISGGQDVGGSSGSPVGAQLSTHGGTGNDEVQLVDGIRVGNMMGGSRTQQTLSPLLYDEVDVQLSGQGGDAVSLGVTSNSIPRSGGNTFAGTVLTNGSGRGCRRATSRRAAVARPDGVWSAALYDLNGSIGGPIVKDRLWFYVTERYQTNSTYAAGRSTPRNPLPTPGNLTRVATADQGYNPQYLWDNTGRVTAALTQKLRVNGLAIVQRKWWPYYPGVTAVVAPESTVQINWPGRIYQGSATYAAKSRLLFEAGFNWQDSPRFAWAPRDRLRTTRTTARAVRVVEQGTTLANGTVIAPITYGPMAPKLVSDNPMKMRGYRGVDELCHGLAQRQGRDGHAAGLSSEPVAEPDSALQYRTLGYKVNQVTIYAPPGAYKSNLDYDTGLYAQDRWTVKRLTLTGAFRLDLQKESYDRVHAGPTQYLPNRAVQIVPGADVVDWKDINPRFGASYDLFGNGRTAVKVSAARGVAGETIATAAALNPGCVVRRRTRRST